ncbi:MAG: NCS2 family permease [Victivallaceae bacterium]|nr:NCS2 family permease [Victivallaceae bacterium]
MNNVVSFLDRVFGLSENGTDVRTELLAGLTSFLVASYVLAANPAILESCGMPAGGIVVGTALMAAVGTFAAGFFARAPFILAPGMGMNAFFAYVIVTGMGFSYQAGLFAVMLEGVLFSVIAFGGMRNAVLDKTPDALKKGFSIGIGLFMAFIALDMAGVVVVTKETRLAFHAFSAGTCHTTDVCAWLAMLGFALMTVLVHRRVRGAIPIAVATTWAAGLALELAGFYHVDAAAGCRTLVPHWSCDALARSVGEFRDVALSCFDVSAWSRSGTAASGWNTILDINLLVLVLIMTLDDVIDSFGSLVGMLDLHKAGNGMSDSARMTAMFRANAATTLVAPMFGVQSTTPFVESVAGMEAGGRTGLAAVASGMLFLLAIPLAPLFLAIPAFAVAPAVMLIGFYMLESVGKVDITDIPEAVPVFVTATGMAFTCSMLDGMCLGIISWTAINLLCGRCRKVSGLMYVLTALSLAKYAAGYLGVH